MCAPEGGAAGNKQAAAEVLNPKPTCLVDLCGVRGGYGAQSSSALGPRLHAGAMPSLGWRGVPEADQ